MGLRVLMAGGGTGGHVIPALAIAREMRDRYGAEVRFVGTARGIESRLVPEAGFPLELIKVGQLANVSLATRLRTYADLPLGLMRCVGLLRSFKPDVVVGVGGYASGPAMMAAVLLRVPTLAYEANAVPGMVNRILGKYVSGAAVAYEQTAAYFRKAVVTGVPVREAIFAVTPKAAGAAPRLLVTAGSNGARVFNELMPSLIRELFDRVPGLTVVHQSGVASLETTRAAYEASGADAARWRVAAFLEDMPGEYQAADLVLARSGSTVAELAAAGRPAVLVPFPQAADDHQRKNAEVLVGAGAAVMLVQAGLVVHQSGAASLETTRAAYEASGADAARWRVAAFLEDMPGEYQAADLVLARSGSTVAELAAAGRPAVLVPFPQAADDHQRKNAEVLVGAGAAVMLVQAGLTAAGLLGELVGLLGDPGRMRAMGERARGLAKPGALRKIGSMVRALAG